MRVIYILRNSSNGGYSIENVFQTIFSEQNKNSEVEYVTLPYPGASLRSLWGNIHFLQNLYKKEKNNDDIIYHITGDVHYACLILPRSRTVLTIHDLTSIEHTKGVKKIILWLFWFYLPLKYCHKITCVSENTKRTILEKFSSKLEKKIKVIYDPVSSIFSLSSRPFNSTKPVLLHIGTKKNKNLIRVIMSIAGIPCHLRIIGKLSKEQYVTLQRYCIEYSNEYDLTNEAICKEYQNCDIVCFPSTYEGFGMPIVEGQKSGKVVLTSSIEPLIEVSGGAACLVDPYKTDDIRQAIIRLTNDTYYRESLINHGFDNVKRFETDFIASEYNKIYKSCINK